jgi:hypothetical protein
LFDKNVLVLCFDEIFYFEYSSKNLIWHILIQHIVSIDWKRIENNRISILILTKEDQNIKVKNSILNIILIKYYNKKLFNLGILKLFYRVRCE